MSNEEPIEQTQYTGRTRRYFLRAMRNGLIAGGGLMAWTGLVEPFWLEVNHQELAIPNLPPEWNGRRLIQISDWHAGKADQSYLKRAIATANSLEPDVLVITGDLVDCEPGFSDLETILRDLKPARLATLGCLGNHDYGDRFRDERCADKVIQLGTRHGVQILRNERVTIEGLDFYGMEDPWSPRFRSNSDILQRKAATDRPAICLCHNPDVCDFDVWGDFKGFVLSGHTHGGQCKPPFLPAPMLPVFNRRYTQGFFDLDVNRQLYISRGIGYTMQVRFNCRPELTVFTMVSPRSQA